MVPDENTVKEKLQDKVPEELPVVVVPEKNHDCTGYNQRKEFSIQYLKLNFFQYQNFPKIKTPNKESPVRGKIVDFVSDMMNMMAKSGKSSSKLIVSRMKFMTRKPNY